jgi:hypothetical protein
MRASSVLYAFVVAFVGIVGCAVPALAAPLTPTSAPLAGSTFQGADGNQVREQGLSDWDALQSAGRVQHNEDPNAADTAFAGGTEEGNPAAWHFTTEAGGVNPAKANILDAWAAVDQPVGGRTFLYLAFARAAPTGDTFLTFELNQDARLWTNHAGAKIPCRRTGDILVSYEISGTTADVFLRRWQTVKADPATGCAETGTILPFAAVKADVQAQGAINAAPIDNHLPGFFGAQIPGVQFGEAALDLDALLSPVFAGGCFAFGSIWMHSRSSTSYTSQMQDIVGSRPIDLRTCAAEGTKFFDLDADGVRDPGDPGIPGFEIFADYNHNGQLDPGEPSTVSDSTGRYVLDDIRPPGGGSYTLRERLLITRRRATTDWVCSFPHAGVDGGFGAVGASLSCGWGPIDPDQVPNATGKDFGNWYPAQLTVRKVLAPASDLGRFNLLVNGHVAVANAQNGSSVTLDVPPGFYTVSEEPVAPTDPTQYTSTVECKFLTRSSRAGSGTIFENLSLPAGGRATCTFRNVRVGAPAIAIDKSGPAVATAGDTLRYILRVTNPGSIPFPSDQVEVSDPACDAPPKLTDKSDGSGSDDSPGTLDHGDTWTYECSRKTDEPGEDCQLSVVANTATATGITGGVTVDDSSKIDTTLTCPDEPTPVPPVPPDPPVPPNPPNPLVPPQPATPIPLTPVVPGQPDQPGAVIPPGPRPPAAGRSAVAGIQSASQGRCVSRLSRITLHGTRISRATVFVDGRLVRRLRGTPLQRRMRISRPGRLAPGRHRVTVRVVFTLGSGTSPLTLTRSVTICRAPKPRFTG